MTAIEALSAEHRLIENVIGALAAAPAALGAGRGLDIRTLRGAVEFLRDYADRRHHQREEGAFFPLLVDRGVPAQGCPIGGLNHEHEKGRVMVSALEETIDNYEQSSSGSDQVLKQALQNLIDLYRKHLWMEDAMVFPMAERLLTEADDRELQTRFADLDRAIGPDAIARLEHFARSLSF